MSTSNQMVERIIGGWASRVESCIGSVHVALTRFHRTSQVRRVRRYQRYRIELLLALRAALVHGYPCTPTIIVIVFSPVNAQENGKCRGKSRKIARARGLVSCFVQRPRETMRNACEFVHAKT